MVIAADRSRIDAAVTVFANLLNLVNLVNLVNLLNLLNPVNLVNPVQLFGSSTTYPRRAWTLSAASFVRTRSVWNLPSGACEGVNPITY